MNVVFEKNGKRLVRSQEDAAAVFLELHGGGWTEEQTALAMEDQRAVLDGETICVNGVDIYTEE